MKYPTSTLSFLFIFLFSVTICSKALAKGSESNPEKAVSTVNVLAIPDPPMLMDITVCEGESTEIVPTAGMGGGTAASVVYTETFDNDGEGVAGACAASATSTCATNVAPANGQWSITGDVSGFTATSDFAITSGGMLEFQDTDTEVCFTTSTIDISSCTTSDFMVGISEAGTMESTDYVDVNLIIDGVSNPIVNWMGLGDAAHTLIDDFTSTVVTQTGIVGSSIVIEICVLNNAGTEQFFLDNIMVGCESSGGGPITFKYYDMDPSAGSVMPIAGPTTDPFDPMTAAGDMGMIWVTACEGTCESEATKVTITVNEMPDAPTAMEASYCDGDIINDVIPMGEVGALFSYYSDAALMNLIQTGVSYTPSGTVGIETIFITQTVNGCESEALEVTIEVLPTPVAPMAASATFCIGEAVEDITATGDAGAIFTYYSDAALTTVIQVGATYTPTGMPGTETIYVTQTVSGCESTATEINITVAGFENIVVTPICNADVLDYCLDIAFDFAGPGPSNMYEVIVNGFVFGPFAYGATGSEVLTICDPINFIGDEQLGLAVEIADIDRGNLTEGVTQTGGGASNLEGCVEISAIMPAQNADNNGDGVIDFCDEYITLTNGGTGIIDISGYTISDAVAVRHIFPSITILNPGQTITLYNSDLNQVANCAGSGIWNNGGDDVILNDASGALVHMETYTGSTAGVQIDFEVIGCGQGTTIGTGPSACLQINSVMANQNADNNGDGVIDFCDEFITITNPGNTPLDISGYMIFDAATLRHIFPSITILAPSQVLTIYNSDLSEVANCAGSGVWNNGGDDIIILDAAGVEVDSETYGSSTAGVEFNFTVDACPLIEVSDMGICSGIIEFDEPNCCPVIEVDNFMGMSICAGSCPAPGSGLMASADCGSIAGSSETKWYSDPAGMFLVFEGDMFDPISEGFLDNSIVGEFTFYAQVSCDFCLSDLVPVKVDIFDCNPPNDACGGCTYMVQLYDTAFDGWDGARFMLALNDGPFVEYKPTASDCGFLSFPIDILDGGEIDYMYMPGANAEEHAYKILDPLGNTVAMEGMAFTGTNIVQATVSSIEANCPACCTDPAEPFTFVFTAGADAFEKSWEIRDVNGTRVAFANAGAYSGVSAGQSVSETILLDPCEEYTITTFSARNNGWEGGIYTIVSSNANRGIPNGNDTYIIASGPDTFVDETSVTFTLPCSLDCPDEETILADDLDNCILNSYTAPLIDAPVCYPNNCHIYIPPSLEVCYPTAIGGLVEGPLGTTSAALPVGSNPVVYKVTYSDGQIIRCTTEVHVISEINPTLVCNDLVILPIIYSVDDCETTITADMILENTDPCNAQYLIEITDQSGNNIGNVVSTDNIGETLDYSITQIGTGLTSICHGQILIEDKDAPALTCFDYETNCNHPNALDEFYTYSETFDILADELPGNIAGGTNSNPSTLSLPIPDVGCGPYGEIIKDIDVTLDITHTDIEDLTIILVAPDGTNLTLLERRTCNNQSSQNIDVTFDSESTIPVFSACNPGIPGLSGTFRPAQSLSIFYNRAYQDLQGDWVLIVIDDDETNVEGAGIGEVLSGSIEIQAGFPFPYAVADCNLNSITLISEVYEDTNCDQTGSLGSKIVRIWQAEDSSGNISQCTQTVGLRAPNLSEVTLPSDIELACGTVPNDPSNLTPEISGTTFFECFEVDDSDLNNCDIIITYEDEYFESCGNGYKLFRTWSLTNWCAGTSVDHVQTILVTDKIGPEITQNNIIISTNEEGCTATVNLEALQVVDACSEITSVTATYTVGSNLSIIDLSAGELINGLPLGDNTITISATDECDNTMEEQVIITVVDQVSPTANCNDELHVTLSDAGISELNAIDLDEGSNDNCGEVSVLIRSLGCEGSAFSESSTFSCCDVGIVGVELLVTDAAGNTNICWAEVQVEDASTPTITCSSDINITCEDELEASSLFESPEVGDNCNTVVTESDIVEVELPNCGKLLTKTYTVSDGSDKSQDATCTQSITITHVSDFIVQFPGDEEFTDCALEEIPGPIISEDDCENIGISIEDRIFEQVEDACYKIERTYTIINHCIVDDPTVGGFSDLGTPLPIPNTFRDDDGYFQYTQIIKVTDTEAPTISFTTPFPCDFSEGCEGVSSLLATTEDACSDISAVELSFEIDAFGDGTFDIAGTGNDATGTYPYGDHIIRWIATDGCGNTSVEEFNFSIVDCKNPTPVCQGVTTVVMNNGDCVSVLALDLLQYVEENCTERTVEEWKANARIRRQGETGALTTAVEICCEDLFLGSVAVEVWVEDEAGNSDFCIVDVEIQDNMENCPDVGNNSARLMATTMTEAGKAIDEVAVEVNGVVSGITNANGSYQVLLEMDEMYEISPSKFEETRLNLSTFDLVLMAQHVLQINTLDSPYKLLAADVNRDGQVDIFDMVELRQIILFQNDEFSNSPAWIFIPASYEFQNPLSPFAEDVPFTLDINLQQDLTSADFIGINMGDLDESYSNATSTALDERGQPEILELMLEDRLLKAGQQNTVQFRAQDFEKIFGFQFTLNLENNSLDIIGEKQGEIKVEHGNFGYDHLEFDKFPMSFHNVNALSVENDKVLFSLEVVPAKDILLSKVLTLSSDLTDAEAYNVDGERLRVALNYTSGVGYDHKDFALYQNEPNPFKEETVIRFNLPKSDEATLSIYDVQGRLVYETTQAFKAGMNTYILRKEHLGQNGLLYYTLQSGQYSDQKKMIIIN